MARPRKRHPSLTPPKTLSRSPPVPQPDEPAPPVPPIGEEDRADPTRYGDWEKKGIAVDF